MVESVWTTTAYSCDMRLREHMGQGLRLSFTRVRMAARSKRPEQSDEESATLAALTVEGDCVYDFCLERESYNSGHSKTNEVFSVLIDGGLGWLYKCTYDFSCDPFRFTLQCEASIVLIDSTCTRNELASLAHSYYICLKHQLMHQLYSVSSALL